MRGLEDYFRNGFPERLLEAGFELTGEVDITRGKSGKVEVRNVERPDETAWLELMFTRMTAPELRGLLRCSYCERTAEYILDLVEHRPDGKHWRARACRGCCRCHDEIDNAIDLGIALKKPVRP